MGKCSTERCGGTTGVICKNIEAREWVEYCPVCRTETPVDAPRRPDAADRLASAAKADFDKEQYEQAEKGFLSVAEKTKERTRKGFYLWYSLLARYGVFYVDDDLHAKKYIPIFMRHPLPDCHLKGTAAYRGIGPDDLKLADDLHLLLRKIDTEAGSNFRVFVAWHGEKCKAIAGKAAEAISAGGYSAFCSVSTLDEKHADEYEPLIYTGLYQADVMAIVVDDLDALNAKFLSKEIERFQNRKKADDRLVTLLFALPGYTGSNTALPNSHVITLRGQTEHERIREIKEAVIGKLKDIRLQSIQYSQPQPAPRPKPLRTVLALLAAVCLLIGGGVLLKWWNDRSQPPQPAGEQGGVGVFAVETERADVTAEPTAEPTPEPTATRTVEPTHEPTVEPTPELTATPTAELKATPTVEPTPKPTATLSVAEQIALTSAQHDSYEQAEKLLAEGRYQEASDAFAAAGDYSDAASRVNEPYYVQAQELVAAGDYEAALGILEILSQSGYSNAYASVQEIEKLIEQKEWYTQGLDHLQKEEYFRALLAFRRAGSYSDAAVKARMLNRYAHNCIIAGGRYHTVGLKKDGTVLAVGDNEYGQCYVGEWNEIVAVSAGSLHTVGLMANGTVVATGRLTDGRCDVGNWDDVVAVAAGGCHTIGLKTDGTTLSAGLNEYGQCEVGKWRDIIVVAAGDFHTIGLKADGSIVTTGWDAHGQCAINEFNWVASVGAGNSHTIGLKTDGSLVSAGWNGNGQIRVESSWDNCAVAAGYNHSIWLKSDGTLVATGDNSHGQCDVSSWTNIGPNKAYIQTLFANPPQ